MKLALAILITIGLLAISDVASTLIYFDLNWILVVAASIWAAIDSSRIELRRYKLAISCRPLRLFGACSLLWIFVFPWYLWARFKIKAGKVEFKAEIPDEVDPAKNFFRRFSQKIVLVGDCALLLAVLAIMSVWLFFTFESWRAPRLWAEYKHQLEAKGESLDWNTVIPPSILDSQNFFEAPMMLEWFVKPTGGIQIEGDFQFLTTYTNTTSRIQIANITIASNTNARSTQITLNFDDFKSHRIAIQLLQNVAGKGLFDTFGQSILTGGPNSSIQVKPLQILLVASNKPNIGALKAFFTGDSSGASIMFTQAGSNSYDVSAYFSSASDYLKWSDQFNADFNLMRDAVKRPYARINGDYDDPPTMPIPNFISLRNVSKTLAQRAQCYLLLGRPDEAMQELTLLNNLRQVLDLAPSNKPMPLVTAMINVAILGVYAKTINDGFQLNTWKEPQLEALETQLQQINLAPFLKEAYHDDEVGLLRTAQQTIERPYDIQRDPSITFGRKIRLVHSRNFIPAFYYLSIINIVKMDEPIRDCFDSNRNIVWPQKVVAQQQKQDKFFQLHFWQFDRLLALIGVPNFSRALKTFALNQNEANEAEIACALERYHLTYHKYPATLDELAPQFIGQLPHDIIDGHPLKYIPVSNDQFTLYSIGWNENNNQNQCRDLETGRDWGWL